MIKFRDSKDTTTLIEKQSLDDWFQFKYVGPEIERSLEPPRVLLSEKSGLVFNMAMTQRLVKDHNMPKAVMLFFDPNTKEMGLWFANEKKNFPTLTNAEKVYKVTYYPRRIRDKNTGEITIKGWGHVRISGGKGLIERYNLIQVIQQLSKTSFELIHKKDIDDNFYIAKLK